MNRIEAKFKELKTANKKAMIPFITSGDPDLETTIEIVYSLEKGGADIIELGIPYSDPLADGPVIQNSSTRALKNGVKISKIMDAVKKIRLKTQVPLVYLVYYSCIFKYGVSRFIKDCAESGIDGLIIPDLPIEEREGINNEANLYDIALIPLVAPTSHERIKKIVKNAKGFIYCVSVRGVTGARKEIDTDIKSYMELISKYSDVPKALGFGISGPEAAKKFKPYCDGIIIGSAIVSYIAKGKDIDEKKKNAEEFVSKIAEIVHTN